MNSKKVTFTNAEGEKLSGRLELPASQHPHNFALFAHCFTCNKNFTAVVNISRELTNQGFGVLRFDFTGLGESEGDFEETNFSGNVEDLIAAADWLKKEYMAPTLLIGHSLGGAAAVFAAKKINSIKALVTIAAPSNPGHVKHLLKNNLEEIKQHGKATVNLSGRNFTIKKQFLEDIESKTLPKVASSLKKALLVMHSPQDITVAISNAEEIYTAAKHPKSFVSLDGADHLLMSKEDSRYVGKVISGWVTRYIEFPEKEKLSKNRQVIASLGSEEGFSTKLQVGHHTMTADEPEKLGGNNFGPSPYEFLSAGLASCTAMTVQMYARKKNWNLKNIEVTTSHDREHAVDCTDCENGEAKLETFKREIKMEGELTKEQRKKLTEIAEKCPVHKTLHSETTIRTETVN